MKAFIQYLIVAILFLFLPNFVQAQTANFDVRGQIQDAESSDAVPFAYVHIEELNRTSTSDINGNFTLKNVRAGNYTLKIHRIGYRTQSRILQVDENLDLLRIKLSPTILSAQTIEVVGNKENLNGAGLEHASKNIFGSDLRRNLGATLSQSLANLPGFDERTNGSATGRPVIRGLGDERVVILKDGMSTGDISAQSADHAVTTDPSSADEIEIARGPAALAYGSNAIGGVINIVKNQIATSSPSGTSGKLSLSGQSMNRGGSAAFSLQSPIQAFTLQVDLSGRLADDMRTPLGETPNTYFRTTNDAIGLSYVQPWGYAGVSGTYYLSRYGIPPSTNGHPEGVDIEMSKWQYDAKSEINLKDAFFKALDLEFSFKDYNHKEIEGEEVNGQQVIGTTFDLLTTNLNIRSSHDKAGFLSRGSVGITGEFQDYQVDGSGTPHAQSLELGAYVIEEADFNAWHLEGGLRLDWVKNRSAKDGTPFYDIGAANGSISATTFKDRDFLALASSLAAIYDLGAGFSAGGSFIHSFRPPSLEELYSEGPHLASYSYEIGNPDLDPERALAKELFIRLNATHFNGDLTFFHNDFSNYLYARNTGRQNVQRADLLDYQFIGTEALLYGAEFSGETQLLKRLVLDASLTYTLANRKVSNAEQLSSGYTNDSRPLPQIPPFKTKVSLRYVKDRLEIGSRVRYAARQDRVGEFETPTDGYTLVDVFSQYRIENGALLHTISLNLNNLFNETYYNHLSRIKDIRPEAGFNANLLYRVYF